MDRETYEQKIKELEASSALDAPARIQRLHDVYKNQQAEQEQSAKQKREAAEASFKRGLRAAYMQQPNATDADFERDYPALRSSQMQKEAQRTDAAARASARSQYSF